MRAFLFSLSTALLLTLSVSEQAHAHCQIPCGIYDDHGRVHQMMEAVTTIDKSVRMIEKLAPKADAQSKNQLARWVATKDAHADHIIETIATYFLTQKIKAPDEKDKEAYAAYLKMLADHHKVMRLAMKAKQTVDADVVTALAKAVDHLEVYWPTRGE